MEIIRVDDTNLRKAAEVHSASWKESHRSFCSPAFVELHTPRRQAAYLKSKMDDGSRIFMVLDPDPVGIVSVTGSLIEDLYVMPGRQNMGYGTWLLKKALEECDGTPLLWILENNTGARRLYERSGFTRTGRIKSVPGGLDEIEYAYRGRTDT